MPSLLLEIGCEELPAGACREAEAQLPELARAHIGTAPSQLFVGPRRLAFLIDDLTERTADAWVKGPPENLRDRAAAGFAKKHGVAVDELELRDGFLGVTVPGREFREVLPEQIDRIVRGFSFTKSMRWDESGIRFARPVRWVLACAVRAHVSHSTLLVSCRLSFPFSSRLITPVSGDYSPPHAAAGAGEQSAT